MGGLSLPLKPPKRRFELNYPDKFFYPLISPAHVRLIWRFRPDVRLFSGVAKRPEMIRQIGNPLSA